jgi:redox-sensitive bicupin YhaK (pirin superfamily)
LLDAIPEAAFDGGVLRVIAGSYLHNGEMLAGAARTHTPIELYDVRLQAGASLTVPLAHRHTAAVFVAEGQLEIEGRQATEANLAVFHSSGDAIQLTARADSKFLVLSGEPIDEPIVSHGPFVMNSREELLQAVEDYRSGRMGRLSG